MERLAKKKETVESLTRKKLEKTDQYEESYLIGSSKEEEKRQSVPNYGYYKGERQYGFQNHVFSTTATPLMELDAASGLYLCLSLCVCVCLALRITRLV